MFSLIYNIALFVLALIALPKLLWQRMTKGKYRDSFRARLGVSLPDFSPKEGQDVIWIHAVSMGETRAVIPLFRMIRENFPQSAIVISSTTETGHAEAKRSMAEAAAHFILPLDFSWAVRRIVDRIRPTKLIMCESDFWYNLLKTAKERGAKIALVNGKVSERSCSRFKKVPSFTRRIFSNFDTMCIQSELYRDRFVSMGLPQEKLYVTGNLKFDNPSANSSVAESQALRDKLNIPAADRVLVIGSTHAPEEEWILTALGPVWKKIPNLTVLLVPRHPERFNEVAHLILERRLPSRRYTEGGRGSKPLILIDAMGLLAKCYQIADLAIVAGSYASNVGGHNIFEPVIYGVPVLFGPHMYGQPDLKTLILEGNAGREVPIDKLSDTLIELLENPEARSKYRQACEKLAASVKGATERTFAHVFK